ncbi:hypothetical protein HYH03_009841 [Edaphochlamys debaryana]|uniref:Uncharacterized protein n=1 Tax=Edaphochlamys debaryana TaxID=47281 RepID=A0A836BY52_9CHLO|nr:hypothetical protein HYH03_009841 [Edaphochlamys debaryana]|eukprot:KAG2491889.1 hypothetical protein HYH03_009841 [Edaphochlamys debaryana]
MNVLNSKNYQGNVRQGDEAIFELVLENKSATDEPVELDLGPDLASNSRGMQLQLMGSPWISPVPFQLPGPFATQTRVMVAAKCAANYPSASVDIVARGTCDMEVAWPIGWPPEQPLVRNAADADNYTPLRLTVRNPRYTTQRLLSHPRLNGTAVRIEYTRPTLDAGVWTQIRSLETGGGVVNFARLEDAYGFASLNWEGWMQLPEGRYLLRWVTYCDITTGGGTDSRVEGEPVELLIDRTPPVPLSNSLWPSMEYLPGDGIFIEYSEPLDCRNLAGTLAVLASYSDSTTNVTMNSNTLIPSCEGRFLQLSWHPLRFPYEAFLRNRTINLAVWGARDMAGNAAAAAVRIRFFMGSVVAANASVVLQMVLGPVPSGSRRLLHVENANLPEVDPRDDPTADPAAHLKPYDVTGDEGATVQSLIRSALGTQAVDVISAAFDPVRRSYVLHVSASRDSAAGLGAADVASRLVAALVGDVSDPEFGITASPDSASSAGKLAGGMDPTLNRDVLTSDAPLGNGSLAVSLRDAVAPLAALDGIVPFENQLLMQLEEEEVHEARRSARRLAEALVLPDTHEGGFLDALRTASTDVNAGHGHSLGAGAGGAAASAKGGATATTAGGMLSTVARYGAGHAVALILVANAAVVATLLALWAARKRRSSRTPRQP